VISLHQSDSTRNTGVWTMHSRRIDRNSHGMRRWLIRGLLGAAIAMVSSITVTAPASADPFWQNFTKTPAWHCTIVQWTPPGLSTETCIIVNSQATQSVVIVRNFSGFAYTIEAPHVRLWRDGGLIYDRNCLQSTLNSGFARACFAPTVHYSCESHVQAQSALVIGGTLDWRRSPTRKMCT
jgi:hypothetical protein